VLKEAINQILPPATAPETMGMCGSPLLPNTGLSQPNATQDYLVETRAPTQCTPSSTFSDRQRSPYDHIALGRWPVGKHHISVFPHFLIALCRHSEGCILFELGLDKNARPLIHIDTKQNNLIQISQESLGFPLACSKDLCKRCSTIPQILSGKYVDTRVSTTQSGGAPLHDLF
jgi:hypothetical protein